MGTGNNLKSFNPLFIVFTYACRLHLLTYQFSLRTRYRQKRHLPHQFYVGIQLYTLVKTQTFDSSKLAQCMLFASENVMKSVQIRCMQKVLLQQKAFTLTRIVINHLNVCVCLCVGVCVSKYRCTYKKRCIFRCRKGSFTFHSNFEKIHK